MTRVTIGVAIFWILLCILTVRFENNKEKFNIGTGNSPAESSESGAATPDGAGSTDTDSGSSDSGTSGAGTSESGSTDAAHADTPANDG